MTGPLTETERRVVAARAILGEWLGGSGGGWQDSGGIWPGIKLIEGSAPEPDDPEHGVSRGRLLPTHRVFGSDEVPESARQALQDSLVLVHGGMAQNVGPVLEMVTEKYLLRSPDEWAARKEALNLLDLVAEALQRGDSQKLGELTTQNFEHPIQTIIPWATNHFTETLIERVRGEFGDDFWGFLMLGGMSGGGMGFLFAPSRKAEAQARLAKILSETKADLEGSLPFAMDPVVYDFRVNEYGSTCELLLTTEAAMPLDYYLLTVPPLLKLERSKLTASLRHEVERFASVCRTQEELSGILPRLFDALCPSSPMSKMDGADELQQLLAENGFDAVQHERVRESLRSGRVGLSENRLPNRSIIEDVEPGDVVDAAELMNDQLLYDDGSKIISEGRVAVVTLAAGAGSRWTQGAGVSKALHPFCKLSGRHRTFLEAHLAKSRRRSNAIGQPVPHVVTTSYLTHAAIERHLTRVNNYGYPRVALSPGRSIGLRMVPMVRDLKFQWEETPQQLLDEQRQKVQLSLHEALMEWARTTGEASDYTDNVASQCLHPVGHWYEIPNLLRNGTLQRLLMESPQLQYLLLHNIDTLGADINPALLSWFEQSGSDLAFEVIPRRLEDRGGGLARVDGRPRILEGLATPRESDEFKLSYYNSMTTWIRVDGLLSAFGLNRETLNVQEKVDVGIRDLGERLPTYVTVKEVKKRWGHGQEDVFPVSQFEKLWGDMSAVEGLKSSYLVVDRLRGQQLKDPSQLDGWLRDGSAHYVESLCDWGDTP